MNYLLRTFTLIASILIFSLIIEVALANVHEITNSKNNLALLGRQKEVLVVNLAILSKVGANNELFSI